MKAKIILAGSSLLFHPYYQYNPFTTVWQLQQEGPGIQAEFRKEEQLVRGRTPKQPVVEEATVAVEVVPQPVVEAVPTAPTTPTPTTPPTTPIAEKTPAKIKYRLITRQELDAAKAKETPKRERPKPKLVLKNQPSQ